MKTLCGTILAAVVFSAASAADGQSDASRMGAASGSRRASPCSCRPSTTRSRISSGRGTGPARIRGDRPRGCASNLQILAYHPGIMLYFKTDTLGTRPSFSGLGVWVSGCGFAQLPNHLTTEPPNQRLGTPNPKDNEEECPPNLA